MHLRGRIERPLHCNGGAVRVPKDVCPGDLEVAQQGTAIGSLLPDGEGTADTGTVCEAPAVIRDHAIGVRNRGLDTQGRVRIREDTAVNQQQRLS